jgi:hypothetical protein
MLHRGFLWMMAAALLAAQGGQAPAIRGDYIEDRSNHVHGCYCEWSGESVTAGREAVLAWQIREGSYGGVDLAGVRLVLVVRGESTLSIGATARQSVLILDSRATAEQRRAAGRLIRDRYGYFLGRLLAERVAEIDMEVDAAGARVESPGLFAVEMRKAIPSQDSLPGAIRWFDPFVPLASYELGTTTVVRYSGPEFGLRWSRTAPATTGYYGAFVFYER